jgi:UDP-N-acetylmuramoyl-tripeptide--D-alanyl-D-alanine ligase
MVAAKIGHDLSVDNESIKDGIKAFSPVSKRMDIIDTGNITIINDVYNASPASVKAAIDVLCYSEGRKVCILGDMFELGDHTPMLHSDVGEYAANKKIDFVICAGKLAQNISDGCTENGGNAIWFENQQDMIENLDKLISDGDSILVKASRGMQFEKTVDALNKLNN